MEHIGEWKIVVYLDEHDRETQALAELTTHDTQLVGHGSARCHPFDFDIPEVGDELATARALSDLAHKLFESAAGDIEDATHHRVTITS
jgi:hypothetical protein